MALRFRRRIRLAPGLRLNLSKSGLSLSAGPRGLSTTFGMRGTYLNTGLPGTGLYSRSRIGGGSSSSATSSAATTPRTATRSVRISVEEDGTLRFTDAEGQVLSQEWIDRAKRQMGEQIRGLIQNSCDEINARVRALGTIHEQTPAPHERLRFEPQEFGKAAPEKLPPKPHGFLGWLLKSVRQRIDAENAKREADHQQAVKEWETAKAAFEQSEQARKEVLEERVFVEVAAMEEVLEGALQSIAWPRETSVSAEVDDGGRLVLLDVDLPEIEDMPKTTASVPARGLKLNVKEMSPSSLQKLYMQHVHGIGFRIIGEVFAVLPKAEDVVLSAFSQRAHKATGEVADEYLYSVRVKRDQWAKINFDNLESLDVVAALERFELRREMSKTGVFKAIEPITISSAALRLNSASDTSASRLG